MSDNSATSDSSRAVANYASPEADSTPIALRRADLIGRAALWSVSLFLICFSLASLCTVVWLFLQPGQVWFYHTFRVLMWATFITGSSVFISLFILHRKLVPPRDFVFLPLDGARVHVGLTAYNDEAAISQAVREFKACPQVHKVVVVENNSKDNTKQAAIDAGADLVVTEMVPGYGSCCQRTLAETSKDADVVILCEGDMTFAAADVKKMLSYLENADMVLGTRATQELRERTTQMDWLINPANQIVAKLVQVRFWGTRLTDMGCTYRAMRVDSYHKLKSKLTVLGNHFSPHMFIEALKMRLRVIEIPIVFRARVGESKGVGSNKVKASKVAIAMLKQLFRA